MSLEGKLVSEINIKSCGDVFHEIFRYRPHHISSMSPDKVQNVEVHEGEWGTVGSVIFWNFIHDGKEKVAKEVIEEIDEEKKLVKFKVIGGDILEAYKSFYFTVHVETKGEDNLVTWILEYEKLNPDVPDPHTLMEFCLNVTKDIETHHLTGKLVSEIEIKSCGDVFHEIFRYRPHHISSMSPDKVQNVEVHEGEWGTVGSVIFWNFIHDGKEKVAKEIIEAIDEEKKLVKFKVIGGDLLEAYNSFYFTVHVETKGINNLVTWILEYEKKHKNVPDPHTLMELCLNVTKDIETHHIKDT
ncbi:hypothetical protein RND71_010641 [Anisodus tanguticus]|uniref:Bet v I/Major latex protein domain-containing protein n=1 Tax=Anisodus tanguticus TaxID=243964 RepID=A0AAE1SM09_9SOLA|nr:hypothetical protein RND71_010641 [Anisodus tanguticus]